jgi:hypothetical protein
MFENLYLDLLIPAWIFFIIFWILIAIAVFYYSRTLPPLSKIKRIILTVLRASVLVIVVFLFLQPVVQLVFQIHKSPTVALLLDNSSSMLLTDRNGLRSDSLKYFLKEIGESTLQDSMNIRKYLFDEKLGVFHEDSMSFSGNQTNISLAFQGVLDSLIHYNIQAIVLVSDGQFNQGMNPLKLAESSPVPIFTVSLGDSFPKKDVKTSGIQVERVVYIGEQTTVKVNIVQNGYQQRSVVVRLLEGKKQISAKTVKLPVDGFEKEILFTFQAEKPGEFRYVFEVEGLEDEQTRQNNRASFMLTVLKSKMKVTLLSGQPNFDQRMFSYVLKQIPDIQLHIFTENISGSFYEPGFPSLEADSQDVYIFMGYPTNKSNILNFNKISHAILQNHIAVLLNLSNTTSMNKLVGLSRILPFTEKSQIMVQPNVTVSLTMDGRLHPVMKIDENPQNVLDLWADLPPVIGLGAKLFPREDVQVLLENTGSKNYPLSIASVQSDTKILLLAITDIGNWHFQLQDTPDRDRFFLVFIERALKWLVNREDIQRLQIFPDKKIYQMGETIQFSGQVYDDFYHQLKDAEVRIQISGEDIDRQDIFTADAGYYFYRTVGLPPGVFRYRLTALNNEQLIGQAVGNIVVEELEIEKQETKANYTLMRQIAEKSNGAVWSVKAMLPQLDQLNITEKIQLSDFEYVLWNKSYWLVISIILLSVEWFLRKRWGML